LRFLSCSHNKLTSISNLPNKLEALECENNLLPFTDSESWKVFNKFKSIYYKLKFR
jgi:Leucine-rich repeat (LRR) protein